MHTAGRGQLETHGLTAHHLEDPEGAPLIVAQLVHASNQRANWMVVK